MSEVLDRLYSDLAEVEAGRRKAVEEAHDLAQQWDEQLSALEKERDVAVAAGDVAANRRISREIANVIRQRDLATHEWDANDPDDPYHPDYKAE